jgi:two-component system chemotaxis response regulator CheB
MNVPAEIPSEIRVLVADDSAVMRTALSRMLESSPLVRVCGTARNGLETVEKIKRLKPDVVTLDVQMPVLDGIDALKRIMGECPCPVIMVSSLTKEGAEITLEALSAGAFDYLPKEDLQSDTDVTRLQRSLLEKIQAAAHSALLSPGKLSQAPTIAFREKSQVVPRIAVIGTSTGGPKALQTIIPKLPADISIPVLVVQHMPRGFTAPLAKRLHGLSKVNVREASQGERLEAGNVYIAPAGQHTTAYSSGAQVCFSLSDTPTETTHKPSVDVSMTSIAGLFGRYVLGIILTGMGSDGAKGMRAIQEAGGITVGQDEATCAVYGMPRICADTGILQRVVPLDQVPGVILEAIRYRPTH